MIIFGQGLNRAHPNLIKIVNTIEKGDDEKGFMKEAMGFLGHLATNLGSSLIKSVSTKLTSKSNLAEYYEAHLGRLAANFALGSDLALVLGGKLKFEEMLSGRLADAFGTLYLGYACLWFYKQNKSVEGIDAVFEMAMESILKQNQEALRGVGENFPVPAIGPLIKYLSFPLGSAYSGPSDKMRQRASKLISTPSGIRELLSQGIFISENPNDRVRMLNDTLPLAVAMDEMLSAAKKAKRSLTPEEEALVEKVTAAVNELVQVDVFDRLGAEKGEDASYVRPALRDTKFAHINAAAHAQVSVSA